MCIWCLSYQSEMHIVQKWSWTFQSDIYKFLSSIFWRWLVFEKILWERFFRKIANIKATQVQLDVHTKDLAKFLQCSTAIVEVNTYISQTCGISTYRNISWTLPVFLDFFSSWKHSIPWTRMISNKELSADSLIASSSIWQIWQQCKL